MKTEDIEYAERRWPGDPMGSVRYGYLEGVRMERETSDKLRELLRDTLAELVTLAGPMTEALPHEIDAHVCDNGEGDGVAVVMPPEMRQWQWVKLTPDDAKMLASRLLRAASLAEKNRKPPVSDGISF